MRTDRNRSPRQLGAPLTRSRRRSPGDEPKPPAGIALPAGVSRAQFLAACLEVHGVDAAIRQLGLSPLQSQSRALQTKLNALAAEAGGAR